MLISSSLKIPHEVAAGACRAATKHHSVESFFGCQELFDDARNTAKCFAMIDISEHGFRDFFELFATWA
jgi:hypothetical protein